MRFIVLWLIVLTVIIAGAVFASTTDFNKDGQIDFQDFVQFVSRFGAEAGDSGYEAKFDLDGSGKIDLTDFTMFAETFGQGPHSEKPALTPDELEALAKGLRSGGKPHQAIAGYEKLLEIATEPLRRARAMNSLGGLYSDIGNLEDAAAYYKRGVADYGDSEDSAVRAQVIWASIGFGTVRLKQGEVSRATLLFEQAKSYFPK